MPGFLDSLFGTTRNISGDINNGLSDDPNEVITIVGKGDGFDYFGTLVDHSRTILTNYLRRPQKDSNKHRVLAKAITEPISFNKAYIERNFIHVHFYSEADYDVANSYDYKKYVGNSVYDGVDLYVTYHISEFLIKNSQLYFVRTINSRSDLTPAINASNGHIFIGRDEVEISEKRFFVISGNVRNSIIKRASLYEEVPFDWELAETMSNDTCVTQAEDRTSSEGDIIDLGYIDKSMSGLEFEKFVGLLLSKNGFTDVRVTKASSDYGCDVIATKDYIKYAVQCKKYSSPVGIEAVQAVLGSKEMYQCHVAVVLTNNTFTPNAKTLADKTNVLLWGRDMLSTFLTGSNIKKSDIK